MRNGRARRARAKFRFREDVEGQSTGAAPVYEVTDDEGHAEKVDTLDLKPLPVAGS